MKMEGGEEKQLAGGIQGYPRDLLPQFSEGVFCSEGTSGAASGGTEEDSGEIELSLGLSLGGCFGVDPAAWKKGLQRSSSITSIPFMQQREEDSAVSPLLLKRTVSLPVEVEEEQRKRKELQCLPRMEAKKKKSERENGSGTCARDPSALPEQEGEGGQGWLGRPGSEHLGGWWAPNRVAAASSNGGGTAAVEGTRGFAAASQGSVGSQGSSSSGVSDIGSRPLKQEELLSNGTGRHWRSSSRTQPLPDLTEYNGPEAGKPAKSTAAGREEEVGAPGKEEPAAGGMGRRNGVKSAMDEMPCVSTRGGGGPNGKLVEGFLYKYGKGEEVRIVCVCHGRFLSPAEFVRHAGGGDVAHPLKHIIVNPSPSCLL